MKLHHIVPTTLALGGMVVLLIPVGSPAWTTLGGSLNATSQRDVRLFNNFTNPGANDNVTADPNFPGFDGAEMAIWKSVVEWGSVLHGTGNGDPHQPGGLGSGGANFDAAWGGNATTSGGTNDNVMDLVGGCDAGVLAYCETPISDGWRIRFCNQWTWDDAPGTAVFEWDIQGIACHEYGHALGLGHTNVSGATMYPNVSAPGVSIRSVQADDIGGVQAIYGVMSGTKPRITSVTVSVGSVAITGQNFGASGVEVWFTKANPTTPSTFPMAKVTGVTSNGTLITVSPPAGAGSGDVLVKNSGSGNNTLSNAWPINLSGTSCPPANPSLIYVDVSHGGAENGSQACPFTSVAEGVSAATAGGEVMIDVGTYVEAPLSITRALTLKASSGDVTIR